ncbi:hypothetical protein IMY05_C4823000200 [Salix suchowensis]|nr:hypothetical protein IMY05_C4823000200 [Salix suchowensis]
MVTVFIPSLEPTSTEPLELKITLQNILSLCSLPVKWLRFVGWAIIHSSSGYLSRDTEGNVPLTDGSVLNDDDTLYYHVPAEYASVVENACPGAFYHPPSDDINDIRNGLLLEANVHLLLDHSEHQGPDNTQFLNFNRAPNYHGAKFHDCSPAGLPEPMLLHHAYGASVIINFATDIARKQDSNKRNRPKHHNQTHGPPQIPRTFEDRVLTGQKCRKADPPSESSGARDSGRVTDDWALDYMYDITLNRFAQREHARWEERKHEISDWAKNFAQGSGG